MSEYSSGELAKLVNVSTRTIQYYDKRNLLKPHSMTETGRRIYNDDDLSRLELILLLKELGLSLKSIAEIIDSDNSQVVLNLLLSQQLQKLKNEQIQTKRRIQQITKIKASVQLSSTAISSITDIEHSMDNKKSLKRSRIKLVIIGIIMDIIELTGLLIGIFRGIWWPFIIALVIALILGVWVSLTYFNNVDYICPNCQTQFKPTWKSAFFSRHNSRARKLVCPHCGQKNYCVEVYADKSIKKSKS